MPLPIGARPGDYDPMNFAGDACQQFITLLKTNDRLSETFGWMFNSNGTISTLFYNEMNRWIYQSLPSSGSNGAYAVTSNSLYVKPMALADNALGRVAWFIANHSSPEDTVGSTVALDAAAPVAITDRFGAAIKKGAIKIGSMVGVINDGSAYRVFTPMGQTSILDLEPGPNRSYLRSFTVGAIQEVQWSTDYVTSDGNLVPIPALGSSVPFVHGLVINGVAIAPRLFGARLVCTIADAAVGYSIGDECNLPSSWDTNTDTKNQWFVWADNTSVNVIRVTGASGLPHLPVKLTGGPTLITIPNWKLRAWAIR